MTTPTLSFSLTKRYPGFALECEADFVSGRVAIFGPSGSGKTTILDAVAGLTQPDAGEVRIAGETVFSSELRRNLPPEKRRIGYVFQDSALFPHMSVRDNILYGHRLTAVERRKLRPEQLVELLGLGALLDRSVAGLSGGERQRVALARALATSPDLLLLDEPLAALDVGFRGTIIRYLKRITRELGTPIVYVSHSMSEVMALAEDVLVVDGGRKVVQAHPSIALAHPGVRALADYATFENLLDAVVEEEAAGDGMATLRIGDVLLSAPDVRAARGDETTVSIRAGDVILALEVPSRISAQNIVRGRVEQLHVRGSRVLVYVDVGDRIVVEITPGALAALDVREGQDVYMIVKSTSILALDGPERSSG
jgi:molybdate transport system ATP-binding protein